MSKMIILDEAWSFYGSLFENDRLIERLREIDGVPNAKFLVEDEKVFVFDALLCKVKALTATQPDSPLASLVSQALPSAWMSAEEAVTAWNVIPEPYKKVENSFSILHEPFKAAISATFTTEKERNKALADLLLGRVIPETGDFIYKGQSFSSMESFDPAELPRRPECRAEDLPEVEDYFPHSLRGVSYIPGFPLLPKDRFEEIVSLITDWESKNNRISRYAYTVADQIWALAHQLDLAKLATTDSVPEEEKEDADALRALYPELAAISDGTLYWLFDSYQEDCCCMRSWTPSRDDDFLFYLIGKVTVPVSTNFELKRNVRDVGAFMGCEMLRAFSAGDFEVESAEDWINYDDSIKNLAWRTTRAMWFLRREKDAKGKQTGWPVTTFRERMTCGMRRKRNYTVITQSLADIEKIDPTLLPLLKGIYGKATSPGDVPLKGSDQ